MRACYDLPAPAKLNLFLRVVGKRADGYHLLQSVFVLIDWADTLHVEKRADGRIARHDLGTALPADDLCLRAARLLQQVSGVSWGADIHIDKQVPWGAGLGGGSSDAATLLLALNRLWGLHWPRARLLELGLQLGADVPFFIGGHNAWVEGIGERLTPLSAAELPPQRWAVVKPPLAIPTREIFTSPLLAHTLARRSLAGEKNAVIVADFLAATRQSEGRSGSAVAQGHHDDPFGCNDLQEAAVAYSARLHAERQASGPDDLSLALDLLRRRYGRSRMSGSGSAVFAPAGPVGIEPAAAGASPIEPCELPAGWTGRLCNGLPQHPLAGWAP